MAIEGFNYQEFATMLAEQAKELTPPEFSDFQKEYLVKTLVNFASLSGEAISNDEVAAFNADQAILLTQIIAEWSFHKSVDLIKSGIQPEYWDDVMKKIAFTIFEMGKQAIKQNLPQDQILTLIEHHVKQSYDGALEELEQRGIIDEELKEQASKQSNIDQLLEQVKEEEAQQAQIQEAQAQSQSREQYSQTQGTPQETKILKLASVALLLKTLSQDKVHSILNKFEPQDAQLVIQYMQMNDLAQKVDANVAIQCLKEIKTNLPNKNGHNTPYAIVSRIQKALKTKTPEKIEIMLSKERKEVKKFVFCACQGEIYEFSPKVANVVAQHIECSV